MIFRSPTWCDLNWSGWLPLQALTGELPSAPGFYRVAPAGQGKLIYLDHTTNLLRRLLGELAPNALAARMPYNDPHPAAPCLWAWRDAGGFTYECSYSLTELEKREREACLCYLLWQYRLEQGESPGCSLGRFHPDYTRSTSRKGGIRGERRVPDERPNPSGGPSHPPLSPQGEFSGPDWLGLDWSPFYYLKRETGRAPKGPGVYRLLKPAGPELLLLGETEDLHARLVLQAAKDWDPLDPLYSFAGLPGALAHQRREVENDLIGAYYAAGGQIPVMQFKEGGN